MERVATISPVKPKPGERISLPLKIDRDGTVHGISNLPAWAFDQCRELSPKVEAEQDRCRGCKGLDCCTKSGSLRGTIPEIRWDGYNVYEALTFCRHERQQRFKIKIRRLCKSAQIPQLYEYCGFDNYKVTPENREAVEAAKWFVKGDSGKGLFIYGPPGTGKTMLAAIVANELVARGKSVLFTSVPDLLRDIRATFSKFGTESYDIFQAIENVDLLVLDDLGTEKISDWVLEQLFIIINCRYNKRLATVITSNYSSNEIVKKMVIVDKEKRVFDNVSGRRIMTRVFGMCQVVFLGGRDYRISGVMK